jgi:hypothetical protein
MNLYSIPSLRGHSFRREQDGHNPFHRTHEGIHLQTNEQAASGRKRLAAVPTATMFALLRWHVQ